MPSDRRLRLFGSTSKRTSHAAQLLWHHRNPDPYRSVPERWREKERAERKGSVSFSFRSIKAHRASRSSKRSESEASLFFLLLSFFPLLLRLPSSLKATRRWPPPRAAATLCRCHSRQLLVYSFASLYQHPPRGFRTSEESAIFGCALDVMADMCTRAPHRTHRDAQASVPQLL